MAKSLTPNKYTKEQRLAGIDMNSLDDIQFKNLMYDIDKLQTLDKNKVETCEFGTYCIDKTAINGLYKKYGIDFQYEDSDTPNADNRFTTDSVLKDIERFSGYNTYEYSKQQAVESMLNGASTAHDKKGNPQYETMRELFDGESKWHAETGNEYKSKSLDDYFQTDNQGNKGIAVGAAGIMDTIYKSKDRDAKMATICGMMNQYYDSPWLQIASIYFDYRQQTANERINNLQQELLTKMEVKDLHAVDNHKEPELSIDKKFDGHVALKDTYESGNIKTTFAALGNKIDDKQYNIDGVRTNIYHSPTDSDGNRHVYVRDKDNKAIEISKDTYKNEFAMTHVAVDELSGRISPFTYSETVNKIQGTYKTPTNESKLLYSNSKDSISSDSKVFGMYEKQAQRSQSKQATESVNKDAKSEAAPKKLTPERETHKDEPKTEPKAETKATAKEEKAEEAPKKVKFNFKGKSKSDPNAFAKASDDLENYNKKTMDAINKAMNTAENVTAKEVANTEYTPAD